MMTDYLQRNNMSVPDLKPMRKGKVLDLVMANEESVIV